MNLPLAVANVAEILLISTTTKVFTPLGYNISLSAFRVKICVVDICGICRRGTRVVILIFLDRIDWDGVWLGRKFNPRDSILVNLGCDGFCCSLNFYLRCPEVDQQTDVCVGGGEVVNQLYFVNGRQLPDRFEFYDHFFLDENVGDGVTCIYLDR